MRRGLSSLRLSGRHIARYTPIGGLPEEPSDPFHCWPTPLGPQA